MIHFVPQQLVAARRRVVERHPTAHDAFDDFAVAAKLNVGVRVERMLRKAAPTNYAAIANAMTSLELRVCVGFTTHPEHTIRMSAFGVVECEPGVASPGVMWSVLRRRLDEPEGLAAARLLLRAEPLDDRQRLVAMLRVEAVSRVGVGLWNRAAQNGETSTELHASLDTAGTALGRVLDQTLIAGVHPRSADWWAIHTEPEFSNVLERTDDASRVAALRTGFALGSRSDGQLSRIAGPIRALARRFGASSALQSSLQNLSADAWRWWQSQYALLMLESFFGGSGDNERFDFWRRWAPRTTRVMGSLGSGRLFLDFGGFGVVEFASSGNAAYVYLADTFAQMWRDHDRNPGLGHPHFKDRGLAIAWLAHRGYWQGEFDHQLSDLHARTTALR